MQRRLQRSFYSRSQALLVGRHGFVSQRFASSGQAPGGRMEDEDPAAVLRQLQEDMRRRATADGKELPPAPPRRSGKTNFFEDTTRTDSKDQTPESSSNDSNKAHTGVRSESKERAAPNPFLKKLTKMESDSQSPSFPTYDATAEERRKKTDAKIKEERAKMLVFRDVGMDLDKPILSRDVFLVFKYFRYGMEFAVDNELERMLRYFNEHAMNELKIIQDSKLMRGPPTLSRKRRQGSRQKVAAVSGAKHPPTGEQGEHDGAPVTRQQQQSLQFQISSLFPHVRCANARQFCSPTGNKAAATAKLSALLSASNNASSFSAFLTPVATIAAETSTPKVYNAKDDRLFTVMSPSMFRRPAVVIFSQLGQKFGSQADTEWRRLAYATICPEVLPYVPMPSDDAKQVKSAGAETQSPYGLTGKNAGGSRTSTARAMPIDVVSLRSADVYKYAWVQRMYINRFAKSLSQAAPAATDVAGEPAAAEVTNALIASTTFVGSTLLEPFYTTLGLRNYLLPHVMLVDHEGVIRWLSGGCPDASEKAVFASLLKQLETEYYKAAK